MLIVASGGRGRGPRSAAAEDAASIRRRAAAPSSRCWSLARLAMAVSYAAVCEHEQPEVGFTGSPSADTPSTLSPGHEKCWRTRTRLLGSEQLAGQQTPERLQLDDGQRSSGRVYLARDLLSKKGMEKQTVESARGSLVNRAKTQLRQRWDNLQEARKNHAPDWKDLSADLKVNASRGEISRDIEAAALDRIRRSLERIERGTYGKCVVCGGEIETERLRAIPDVERCAGCTH
jgi:DnaK suppressor protein